jgi:hypothetical protein
MLIYPLIMEYNQLVNNKKVLEQNKQTATEYYNQQQQTLQRLREEDKSDLVKIEKALPKNNFLPELYSHFKRLSEMNACQLSSISISGEEKLPESMVTGGASLLKDATATNIQLGLTCGEFSYLVKVLRAMANSERLIDVTSLSFSSVDTPGKPFSVTLAARIYQVK